MRLASQVVEEAIAVLCIGKLLSNDAETGRTDFGTGQVVFRQTSNVQVDVVDRPVVPLHFVNHFLSLKSEI